MSTPELWSKSVKLVTPELAMLWLTSWNAANYRRPSAATVRDYARKMSEGRWLPRHPDAIQFDWNGNLGNGQHRLLALVAAGVSIEMFVEHGIDPALFDVTDTLRMRTDAHRLTRRGFRRDVSHAKAAAVTRAMLRGMSSVPQVSGACDYALEHEDLIGTFLLELAPARPSRCEVVAAYCKATFEFGDTAALASAKRYAEKRFAGPTDSLVRLHDKVVAVQLRGCRSHDLYAYAVAAIRADLEGRSIGRLQQTGVDFTVPDLAAPKCEARHTRPRFEIGSDDHEA